MALISIPTDHTKLRKTMSLEKKPKPLMLKDYLLRDDLSSCSSNGFKSFPRQHCCTTVRFLLEAELKKSKDNYSTTTKRRSRSKTGASAAATTTTTTISALQRASEAVLNAVKLLPFPSIKSTSPPLRRNSFTRSFSRKLFKRSFWRKADKENDGGGEIRRCKLFREFLEEKNQPSDQNTSTTVVVVTADTSATTMIAGSSRVLSNTSSNTWSESEFTADVLQSWSVNSESSSENDTVEGETNLPQKEKVSNVVGEESINFTKEQDWAHEEGKEQFSPVSVLDCPFDDEEEEDNSSHFEDGSPHVKAGTKQKLMQKVRRLEGLTQLEPVDLETRIAMTELEDEDREIIELVKARIPWEINKFMEDGLVLDLYRETGLEDLKMVENWVNGKCEDMFVGWEMEEGRKAYLKEMERNGNWRKFNEEEEDVGTAVELEVLSSLLDELLTDLF